MGESELQFGEWTFAALLHSSPPRGREGDASVSFLLPPTHGENAFRGIQPKSLRCFETFQETLAFHSVRGASRGSWNAEQVTSLIGVRLAS